MTDRNKFEEMLELLVNEDKAAAEELFHEIVVEKSREIYATMLESDIEEDEEVEEATDEEVEESSDEEVDEATDEEVDESSDEEVDEGFDLEEFEVEADDDMDPMAGMGGDADDMDLGPMGGEEEGEGDGDGAMDDLEDALNALQQAFAELEAEQGEGGDDDEEDEEEPEEESFAFESDDEAVEEASDEEVEEASEEEVDESVQKSAGEMMREFIIKTQGGELGSKIGGDNGANAKSPVAGKNDMGGTASNLNQGKDNEAGDHAGLGDINPKEHPVASKQTNKPGGNKATTMSSTKGHGAEKKQSGGDNGANAKSTIGS